MNIHLIRTDDVARDLFEKVTNLLIAAPGPMRFLQHEPLKQYAEPVVAWDALFTTCNQFRKEANAAAEDFIVLLTTHRNTENWFSAYDPKGTNSIFIYAAEWENYLDCAPEFPLAYEAVENILVRLMFARFDEMLQATHDPAIGCICDMCSWKADILYKLRTADICPTCLGRLDARGVDPDLVGQIIEIIENIRPNVLFRGLFKKRREDDEALPFPAAITRRKMNLESRPLSKLLYLLDHFDALARTAVTLYGNIILGANFAQFYREQGLAGRPSSGDRVTALAKLSRHEARASQGHAHLTDEIMERFVRITTLAQQEPISQMRSERGGQGYLECYQQTYQDEFEENIGTLVAIEEFLKPVFAQYPLFYVEQTDRREDLSFAIRAKKLMGSHPDFLEETISLTASSAQEAPASGKVYAVDSQGGQWHTLSPYILYGRCPGCAHPRVLVNDGEQYIDPYIGHRVTI